jgi:hypothetical protein
LDQNIKTYIKMVVFPIFSMPTMTQKMGEPGGPEAPEAHRDTEDRAGVDLGQLHVAKGRQPPGFNPAW